MGHFASRVQERKGSDMNRDIVKGNCKQFRGEVKAQWSKLTDDPVVAIAGNRDELAGKMQESHGVAKGEAARQSRISRRATGMPVPGGGAVPPWRARRCARRQARRGGCISGVGNRHAIFSSRGGGRCGNIVLGQPGS